MVGNRKCLSAYILLSVWLVHFPQQILNPSPSSSNPASGPALAQGDRLPHATGRRARPVWTEPSRAVPKGERLVFGGSWTYRNWGKKDMNNTLHVNKRHALVETEGGNCCCCIDYFGTPIFGKPELLCCPMDVHVAYEKLKEGGRAARCLVTSRAL